MALTDAQREQLEHVQRSMLKRLEKVYTLLSDAALELANMEHALQHVDPDAVDPGLTALAMRAFSLQAEVVAVQDKVDAVTDALIDRMEA